MKELQTRMDAYYAWLVFAYCLYILAAGITVYACLTDSGISLTRAALLSMGVLIVALSADVAITRDELWLVVNHPQFNLKRPARIATAPTAEYRASRRGPAGA